MAEPRSRRRRKQKPPRVVLLDTRDLVQLDTLAGQLTEQVLSLGQLIHVLADLGEMTRTLIPLVSEMHAAQQRRSEGARRANRTRKATPQPADAPPASPTPTPNGESECSATS